MYISIILDSSVADYEMVWLVFLLLIFASLIPRPWRPFASQWCASFSTVEEGPALVLQLQELLELVLVLLLAAGSRKLCWKGAFSAVRGISEAAIQGVFGLKASLSSVSPLPALALAALESRLPRPLQG